MLGFQPLATRPLAALEDEAFPYHLPASSGSYAVSGQAVGLRIGRVLAAGAGSYSVTGQAIGLFDHPPKPGGALLGFGPIASRPLAAAEEIENAADYLIEIGAGSYTLTGQNVALRAARVIISEVGS